MRPQKWICWYCDRFNKSVSDTYALGTWEAIPPLIGFVRSAALVGVHLKDSLLQQFAVFLLSSFNDFQMLPDEL